MEKALGRLIYAVMLVCLGVAFSARATEILPPDVLAKKVTADVLAILKTQSAAQNNDPRRVEKLVEAKVLPHFDFVAMTRLAMGSNWREATPAQRTALTDQFRALLVHIYTASLARYGNQTVKYQPLKLAPDATDAEIRSQIMGVGKEPIPVNYSMEKTADGWKVYDLNIDGMSLVENYRNEFDTRIRNGGIDGLIKALTDKNEAFA